MTGKEFKQALADAPIGAVFFASYFDITAELWHKIGDNLYHLDSGDERWGNINFDLDAFICSGWTDCWIVERLDVQSVIFCEPSCQCISPSSHDKDCLWKIWNDKRKAG